MAFRLSSKIEQAIICDGFGSISASCLCVTIPLMQNYNDPIVGLTGKRSLLLYSLNGPADSTAHGFMACRKRSPCCELQDETELDNKVA